MRNIPSKEAEYWNQRYRQKQTGWDIGHAAPALVEFAQHIANKNSAVLIPGCGNAYEAEALFTMGFHNITLLDIAPTLTEALRNRLKQTPIKVVTGDFFTHEGQYDLILEQTFFCAIDPRRRSEYIKKMHELLTPGGLLVGLLFDRLFEDGPPYGGSKTEYEMLLSPLFTIQKMESCYNSIAPRAGTELFFIARRNP